MTASSQIDAQIANLADWRGDKFSWYRQFVHQFAPELKEEFKWGVGVFTYDGKPVLAFSAFKDHVKFNFFHGAQLVDNQNLFNSGLDSKQHRSANLGQNDKLDEEVLRDMIVQSVKQAMTTK